MLNGARAGNFYPLLGADHHYGMDKKPHTFQLTFPGNLAFIKYRLTKLD
jgi:hypothetical protein